MSASSTTCSSKNADPPLTSQSRQADESFSMDSQKFASYGAAHEIRVVIALDLDNFYVGVERIRNPALKGLPVGITQKGILATCSYEARARGVGKLMSIKKGKVKCPEMILVNGSDLTPYRHHSRLVFSLVTSLLGPQVEKLGMDEVFVDVSDLVLSHLKLTPQQDNQGQLWLQLAGSYGLWYSPYKDPLIGHLLPKGRHMDPENPWIVASHIADFVRREIVEKIGLTSSAGVASNKSLAKLAASINKPSDQTTFTTDHQPDIQAFMDPIPVRKLNGFGFVITRTILEAIGTTEEEGAGITVKELKHRTDLTAFIRLFGKEKGTYLWGLLSGDDSKPVLASPEFPKQISVEDSFAQSSKMTIAQATHEMTILTCSLLKRLQEELLTDVLSPTSQYAPQKKWLRYPETIRLSIRRTWNEEAHRAKSATASMPSGIFNISDSIQQRADMLVFRVLKRLLRDVLGSTDESKVFDCWVINVSAGKLSTTKPATNTLESFLAPPAHAFSSKAIVGTGFAPIEILDDSDEEVETSDSRPKKEELEEVQYLKMEGVEASEKDIDQDEEDGDEEDEDLGHKTKCDECEEVIWNFALDAHKQYHQQFSA